MWVSHVSCEAKPHARVHIQHRLELLADADLQPEHVLSHQQHVGGVSIGHQHRNLLQVLLWTQKEDLPKALLHCLAVLLINTEGMILHWLCV